MIAPCFGAALAFAALCVRADQSFVARVYYGRDVTELTNVVSHYDVHEYNNFDEHYILVTVNSGIFESLRAKGFQVEYDGERTTALEAPDVVFRPGIAAPRRRVPFSFYGVYKTVDEIYADLHATTAQFPAIAQLIDYGDAYCKTQGGCVTPGGDTQTVYDLLAVKVTNRAINQRKPVLFVMAGIHAREITTPEIALRFLQWLVGNYGIDPEATWLVDWNEIWIVPTANPEGHWLVELGDATAPGYQPYSQRKNAHQSSCLTWPPKEWSQYGVDLNRNHSYMWNNGGSSGLVCDPTYRGPSAASEPETAALQQLLSDAFTGTCTTNGWLCSVTNGIFISIHSYGRLVIWPWGYTQSSALHGRGLEAIGTRLASFNGYVAKQAVKLYPTSGDSCDFVYGTLGKPAYTFELGNQFIPDYSEIDFKQWPRNKPALIHAAKLAAAPYDTVYGPDVTELDVSYLSNGNALVTGVVDDSTTGGVDLHAAELYLGMPPWIEGATGMPMVAVDGTFDSVIETVQVEVAMADLPLSNLVVLARAQDDGGTWGPPTGAFLDAVPEPGWAMIVLLVLVGAWIRPLPASRSEYVAATRRNEAS